MNPTRVADQTLRDDFRKAIDASLVNARTIVQAERTEFFANYAFPEVDLSESLFTAATAAASSISSFESPAAKKRRERAEARESRLDRIEGIRAETVGLLEEQKKLLANVALEEG